MFSRSHHLRMGVRKTAVCAAVLTVAAAVAVVAPAIADPKFVLAALIAVTLALFSGADVRRRRRLAKRIAADHLEAVSQPPVEAATAAPPPETRHTPPAVASSTPVAVSSGLPPASLVIGYVTQPMTVGHDLQRSPELDIERFCQRTGWELVTVVRDREQASIFERPCLSNALRRISEGDAQALVVNDVRLLSRFGDFARFVQWFRDAGAPLIALDLGVDTSTPEGARVASALITVNGWAGEWITRRTHRSLADVRPAMATNPQLAIDERPEVLQRIADMLASGSTSEEIADTLNNECVPTLFGTERWWPSSVHAGLRDWRAATANAADPIIPSERRATG